MPLVLDTPRSGKASLADRGPGSDSATIEIACLNNLGDAGLETGERQIVNLLTDAAGAQVVRLRFFSLPTIERGVRARARMDAHYTDFADLMQSRVDGLIVTGCEPRANRLPDEPFWQSLTNVIDWAEHNTKSTIWSCLAAHAAVLHLDGVQRRPLAEKCTGIFRVDRLRDHPLTTGIRGTLHVPHSRYNGLAEEDLAAAGYEIVTRSAEVGVDLFVKQWRSLFVYLQGHPEYDTDALRREYRRDVVRYLDGTIVTYPRMPENYFGADMERAMTAFEMRARQERNPDLGLSFPNGADQRPWRRAFAQGLFRNWLKLIGRTPTHPIEPFAIGRRR